METVTQKTELAPQSKDYIMFNLTRKPESPLPFEPNDKVIQELIQLKDIFSDSDEDIFNNRPRPRRSADKTYYDNSTTYVNEIDNSCGTLKPMDVSVDNSNEQHTLAQNELLNLNTGNETILETGPHSSAIQSNQENMHANFVPCDLQRSPMDRVDRYSPPLPLNHSNHSSGCISPYQDLQSCISPDRSDSILSTPQANSPFESSTNPSTPTSGRSRRSTTKKYKGKIRGRHCEEWIDNKRKALRNSANCIFAMFLDVFGRRNCLLVIYIPKLIVAVFFIFATEVWMLILGRAVITAFDCYTLIIVPVYSSELASNEYRSILVTLIPVTSGLGELVTYSIGPFVSYQTFSILFACIIAFTFIPILIFLPETPSFLYSKGREEEALKVLIYLRGSFTKATKEIESYKLLSYETTKKMSKMTILRDRVFRKSLILALILTFGAQLSGFNVLTFYLQTILLSTDTKLSSELASLIIGLIQVISSLFTHVVISSRVNRKTILVVSLSTMCMGMTGLGAFFKISEPEDYVITGFMNYLPLICLIVTIASFIAGIGSMLYLIIGELFTDSGRAFGVSIAVTGTSALGFLTVKYFPIVASNLGPSTTFWIYSSLHVLFITLIVLFVPETNGKTYIEIQKSLGRKFEDEKHNKEDM